MEVRIAIHAEPAVNQRRLAARLGQPFAVANAGALGFAIQLA